MRLIPRWPWFCLCDRDLQALKTSHAVHLQNPSLWGRSRVLYVVIKFQCRHCLSFVVHQETLLQIVLHVNMPEITCPVSGFWSLNQQSLLSHDERDFLPHTVWHSAENAPHIQLCSQANVMVVTPHLRLPQATLGCAKLTAEHNQKRQPEHLFSKDLG